MICGLRRGLYERHALDETATPTEAKVKYLKRTENKATVIHEAGQGKTAPFRDRIVTRALLYAHFGSII